MATNRQELQRYLESLATTIRTELTATRKSTEDRLETMRRTVDEQLQGTLEKRLGESFRLVSDRLEQVYRGLGEMQTLASGVGDLKRVFSDVRARGAWGEIQLGALLEQMLAPDQFARNVATGGTTERVEFAIRMPGTEPGGSVWLPIDAKFPQEDYLRLVEASERCDPAAVEFARANWSPAEGLRSRYRIEIRPSPRDYRFRDPVLAYRKPLCGGSAAARSGRILAARLPHRRRRTDHAGGAPEQLADGIPDSRDSEAVQRSLARIRPGRTEFSKYADVLARVQKKLQEASNTVDQGLTRTRVLERKLRSVDSPELDEQDDQWRVASGE